MMSTPKNEYVIENEEKMYNVLATRIKLLLDTGLLSVFQHHTDINFIIVWFFFAMK